MLLQVIGPIGVGIRIQDLLLLYALALKVMDNVFASYLHRVRSGADSGCTLRERLFRVFEKPLKHASLLELGELSQLLLLHVRLLAFKLCWVDDLPLVLV